MKRLPLVLLLALLCAGCEDGKETRPWYVPKNPDAPAEEPARTAPGLIGTWELSGTAGTWHIHFLADGTWRITDDREGGETRVYGNYSADDSSFRGNMTNPGVGTGSIAGYYNGRSLALDFYETWDVPPRHISYTGTKR